MTICWNTRTALDKMCDGPARSCRCMYRHKHASLCVQNWRSLTNQHSGLLSTTSCSVVLQVNTRNTSHCGYGKCCRLNDALSLSFQFENYCLSNATRERTKNIKSVLLLLVRSVSSTFVILPLGDGDDTMLMQDFFHHGLVNKSNRFLPIISKTLMMKSGCDVDSG